MKPLRSVAMLLSLLALVGVLVPSVWYLLSNSEPQQLENAKLIMTIATILWFVTAPLWMLPPKASDKQGSSETETVV